MRLACSSAKELVVLSFDVLYIPQAGNDMFQQRQFGKAAGKYIRVSPH